MFQEHDIEIMPLFNNFSYICKHKYISSQV